MPENSTPGSRGLILLADDERLVRAGLGGLLERLGFKVVGAATADEAVEHLKATQFDAMISDIHMPGNVGLELISSAPQIAEGLPIILLTGRPTVETAAKSVRLAVAAYLTKPPDMDELCAILDDVIARHRGFRALRGGRDRLAECNEELARIEETLKAARGGEAGDPLAGYLRVTLRQIMLMLSDVAQATAQLDKPGPGKAALEQVDLVAAMHRTVDVLERTKRHFKSKDLAELRKDLEKLLERSEKPPPESSSGPESSSSSSG